MKMRSISNSWHKQRFWFFGMTLVIGGSLPLTTISSSYAQKPTVSNSSQFNDEEKEKTKQKLTAFLQELPTAPTERKLAISKEISQGNPRFFEVYAELLSASMDESIPAMQAIIWSIGGQYPKGTTANPAAWTRRPEKKAKGEKPIDQEKQEPDWLSSIIQLPETDFFVATKEMSSVPNTLKKATPENSELFKKVQAAMIFRIALLRGLANMGMQGNLEAAKPIFDFAFIQKGTFRDECGRILRSMETYAVPELILRAHDRAKNSVSQNRYANFQLDYLDYQSPAKALRNAATPQVRAAILRAFGEVQEISAVEYVLFDYIHTSNPLVKEAARWAFMRYVNGPKPKPSPCRRRKLPGGKEESTCKEDYWDFRKLAKERAQDALKQIPGYKIKPQDAKGMDIEALTNQLFAYYDHLDTQSLDQGFLRGQAALKANDLKRAIDIFSWILLHQPNHPKRKEMAQAFADYGEQLAQQGETQKDQSLISQALGYLRKALILSPQMEKHNHLEARIHFLDGKQAQAYGGDGVADFQLALQADPTYLEAQNELSRLGKNSAFPATSQP